MATDGKKLQDMARDGKKLQEMARDGKRRLEMTLDDKRWQEMTRDDKRWQEMTRDDNKHMSATFATKSAQICACLVRIPRQFGAFVARGPSPRCKLCKIRTWGARHLCKMCISNFNVLGWFVNFSNTPGTRGWSRLRDWTLAVQKKCAKISFFRKKNKNYLIYFF